MLAIIRDHSGLSGRHLWSIAMVMGLLPLIAACGGAAGTSQPESQSGSSNASSTVPAAGQTTGSSQQKDVATGEAGTDSGQATVAKASYVVPTITCPSCSARVHASAMEEPGVIDTSIRGQDVSVTYDPKKTDPKSIAATIREYGDTVERRSG
jgi:copper chaperone CopZ